MHALGVVHLPAVLPVMGEDAHLEGLEERRREGAEILYLRTILDKRESERGRGGWGFNRGSERGMRYNDTGWLSAAWL